MNVQVVVPLPVEQTFTYRVPEALIPEVQIGVRVVVPFGTRHLTGVVVSEADDEGDWKELVDVLDERPSLTAELLELSRWMADYYLCGWGEVVRAALPSGIEIESRRALYPGTTAPDRLDERATAVMAFVERHPGADVAQTRRALGSKASSGVLRKLEAAGILRVEQQLAPPKVRSKRRRFVRLAGAPWSGGPDEIESLASGPRQRAALAHLVQAHTGGQPEIALSDLAAESGVTAASLSGLEARGLIEIMEREVIRTPLGELPVVVEKAQHRPLHPAQEAALAALLEAVEGGSPHTFLLHGITGSGKTEVYIRALERVLEMGKSGIVLVPEIALTPQTVQRFRAHLGAEVEVLHSRMSAGERFDTWRTLRQGDSRVVIGPRSAVFAPLEHIGLIVVDEEHETSYKQFDPAPRYHARDVAVMRARLNGAVCVLGSATPSLESIRNARAGKYTLLSMPTRVPVEGTRTAQLPSIRIVDLTLEQRKHRLEGVLAYELREAIGERLDRQEQVILLQNRRGYASILECQSCGWAPQCADCAVTLTLHKQRRHLRCHYCGSTRRVPRECPECGSTDLHPHGVGTQRVEEELATLFPDAGVLRMDLDTTRRKDAHREILSKFRRGKADILVGTQMVAKGLDFERVTLVGVVNADTGLLLPDFRSAERTFQMLTQVAGRSGRSVLSGEVILQTRNPDHPVITLAAAHKFDAFVEAELAERERLDYPPHARLIGLEFRGPDEKSVADMASAWTQQLRRVLSSMATPILGPEPAFVARVKRKYRVQTLIKIPATVSPAAVKNRLREVEREMPRPSGETRVIIDVDPFGLF